MSVRRVSNTPWYHYILWHLARDEWAFTVDDVQFRVTNEWIGPTKLLQGNTVLAEGKGLFEVSGKKPFLTAKVNTVNGRERSIAVYFQALLKVNARIEVDGEDFSKGFA